MPLTQNNNRFKNKFLQRLFIVTGIIAFVFIFNAVMVYLVQTRIYERKLMFIDNTPLEVIRELKRSVTKERDEHFQKIDEAKPFQKTNTFDQDALCWSNQFSQYGAAGILVFDANGDGLLDVYFCQDGQNWTRPTNANAVLEDKPRFQHNGLYLNQGNNSDGSPIFKQISELCRTNNTNTKAELLVEDFLYPRSSVKDNKEIPGRGSNVAVAADFNNDGRLDLLIGNEPKGMFWSHPKTQRVLMQFVNPVGREAKKSKQPLSAMGMHFIKDYQPRNSIVDKRKTARGEEFEGANSLYINMGDADNDGIPEWRDASRDSNIEGFRPTYSLNVADIDLDGDLDVFVGNTCDMDYWIGGSKYWAGGANCMYINQLVETGELTFIEKGAEMDVDGVYDDTYPKPDYYRLRRIPLLPAEYSILFMKYEAYKPKPLVINGQQGEQGQISWSTVLQDVNNDGYPDVWVANDMGYLRLYLNEKGKRFKQSPHARSNRSGMWMTFAPGDFNGDQQEDMFAGNLGGAVMNHAFATPDPYDIFDPVILNATIFSQFFNDKHDTRHTLIDGADFTKEMPNKVKHSSILPPDVTIANNYRRHAHEDMTLPRFDPDELNAYEFSWGATSFDLQNDGLLDLYYIGCLYGRGGGLFPISGTGPGRMLVNATKPGSPLRFIDQTAQYHLFNIEHMQYDKLNTEGYIYRKAPLQNWRARDMVYSYDRSNWSLHGPGVQERVTNQDMIQTAENGRAVVAADMNNDGYPDLILRNQGGYDSRSPSAKNLKSHIEGRPQVVPAHNANYPNPTNFEPGKTWLFVNTHHANNWIKVKLIDDTKGSFNRDAIGAKVVINNTNLNVKRCGDGGFLSNKTSNLLFGLGQKKATAIKIQWPDLKQTTTTYALDNIANTTLTISKTNGVIK